MTDDKFFEQELKEPAGAREAPLGWTYFRHRLNDAVFGVLASHKFLRSELGSPHRLWPSFPAQFPQVLRNFDPSLSREQQTTAGIRN